MASGQTLLVFTPLGANPPSASYGLFGTLNGQPTFNFATLLLQYCVFAGVMPRNYAGTTGITLTIWWTGDAAPVGGGGGGGGPRLGASKGSKLPGLVVPASVISAGPKGSTPLGSKF